MHEVRTQRFNFFDVVFFVTWCVTLYFTRNMLCSVMMLAFCGCFAVTALRRPLTRKRTSYFFWSLAFILYGYFQIKLGNAIDAKVATTMVRSLVWNLIMVYAIVQYIQWKGDLRFCLKLLETAIFLAATFVVVTSWRTLGTERLGTGTEMNANLLAMFCVYGLTLSLYLKRDSSRPTWYWAKIAIYILFVLLSGSRKGLTLILLVWLIISLAHGKKRMIRNVLLIAIGAFFLYYAVMNVDALYNVIGHRVENLLYFLQHGSTSEGSLDSRRQLVEFGWGYVQQNPWTGYGYDCFKVISPIRSSTNEYNLYSHNNYVELLFGGGIFAFILYYVPMLLILKNLTRHLRTEPCVVYLLAIFAAKHAIEYAYVSYYSRVDAYLIAVILGALTYCENKRTEEANLR